MKSMKAVRTLDTVVIYFVDCCNCAVFVSCHLYACLFIYDRFTGKRDAQFF